MPVIEDLWPEISEAHIPSEPAEVLREQAEALSAKTDGILFGTVEESEAPPLDEVAYDLYINVADKPYRYLLLSVQHGLSSDYPARITNTLAGTVTQADRETFKDNIRRILNAPSTRTLLERMMSFANRSEVSLSVSAQ